MPWNFKHFLGIFSWVCILILIVPCQAVLNTNRFGESYLESVTWGLTDANRTRTCILLSGYFEIAVPYRVATGSRGLAVIIVPTNASVSGSCDIPGTPFTEEMTLEWEPRGAVGQDLVHSLTFVFLSRGYEEDGPGSISNGYFELVTVRAKIYTNEVEFPDALQPDLVYNMEATNLRTLSAPETLSYYCKATQLIEFDDGVETLGMSQVHAEAFHTDLALGDGEDFGSKSFCAKDGFEVILMVVTYVFILGLIGLGVFYLVDRRYKKGAYMYI